MWISRSGVFGGLASAGLSKTVGVGAGLDEGRVKGEPVDDGGAEPGFGKGLGLTAEALIGGDGDAGLLLTFGQHLEEQVGAAFVEFPCIPVRRCRAGQRGRSG
jgi:hypothetical protein